MTDPGDTSRNSAPPPGGFRKMLTNQRSGLRQVLSLWRTWVIIFTPLIFLPVPLVYPSRAGRCAYAVLIMAVYWMTEAIPMAVTALLPVVLMPLLGVLGSKEISLNYLKDTNMLFFGGLMVAVAVEKWNLHKRIALRVLMMVGAEPRWLMFGFMSTTAFLSMWISNTATTAMMVPIAQAVLTQLSDHLSQTNDEVEGLDNQGFESPEVTTVTPEVKATAREVSEVRQPGPTSDLTPGTMVPDTDHARLAPGREDDEEGNGNVAKMMMMESVPSDGKLSENDRAFSNVKKGLTLCVAYAANIGGTATLTGTGPNLVMKGQVDTLYGSGAGINFSSWFIYSFPNMVVTLLVAWLWLQLLFLGPREMCGCCCKGTLPYDRTAVSKVIKEEYRKLGGMSFAEVAVLCHFIILALLWLTREPEFVPGWSVLFTDGYVTDACVAITIAVILFIFPSRMPNILCFRKKREPSVPGPVPSLLDWETVHQKMAWGIVLVLGGGFSLAQACKESGLSDAIGSAFSGLGSFPTWVLILVLCVTTAGFTEVTSNVATNSIFLPILAQLAETIGVNPLYLIVPTTVATSFAFMLPVATPPNAIVFAYGNMKIYDMVRAGIVMNILAVIVVTFSINTWGFHFFHLGTFPDWANHTMDVGQTIGQNLTAAKLLNCSVLLGNDH